MLRSSLCDYSDACMLVKGTKTVSHTVAQDQTNNGADKMVKLNNSATFTKCISRINNRQVDDVRQIDAVNVNV